MTVTGVLERLVVDTEDGGDTRYAVRSAERTWWLDGLTSRRRRPGASSR